MAIFIERKPSQLLSADKATQVFVVRDNSSEVRRQASLAASYALDAQRWAQGSEAPDGVSARSAEVWAREAAMSASSAAAAGNYYATLNEALAATAMDDMFTTTDTAVTLATGGTNVAGWLRTCARISDAPYYVHLGASVDPLTSDRFETFADSLKIIPELTGSSNETAAVQAALTATSVVGKRIVEIKEGTFSTTTLTVPSGTWLRGRGIDKTTIRRFSATTQGIVRFVAGASDITISDMTIDGANAADVGYLLTMLNITGNITIERVRFKNWTARAAVNASPSTVFRGLRFRNCEFINCTAGGILILGQNGAQGSSEIEFIGNIWDGCGGSLCQLHEYEGVGVATMDRRASWYDVRYNFNVVRNCVGFGVGSGPIPNELWACKGLQQVGNLIESGTRGLSASAYNEDVFISHNVIKNQTFYAMEAGPSRNVKVMHNVIVNCASFYKDTTGATGKNSAGNTIAIRPRMTNVEICNNLIVGSGLAAYNSSTDTISMGSDGASLPTGISIHDNVFRNVEFCRSLMRMAGQATYPAFAASTVGAGATFGYSMTAVKGQVENKGFGYVTAPTVSLLARDGNGTGMAATVSIDAIGRLDKVIITAPGSGYTAPPQVVLFGGGGSEGDIDIIMGIETITVTNGGTGYSAGTFTVSGNGAVASATGTYTVTDGVIIACSLTAPGEGFGRASDFFVYNNTAASDTYNSTIPYWSLPVGRFHSRGNRWIRHAKYDASHPNAAAGAPVYGTVGSLQAGGNPRLVSENDSAEMLGPNSVSGLRACGVVEAAVPRYGCLYKGFRAGGNFSDNPFCFADSGGTTGLENFDIGDLMTPSGVYLGGVNSALLFGIGINEYVIQSGAFVNLGTAKKSGRHLRLKYAGGTTQTIAIRHDKTTGGQTLGRAKVDWSNATNNTVQGGECHVKFGNVSSTTANFVAYNGLGGAATFAQSTLNGYRVLTITLPSGNNSWLAEIELSMTPLSSGSSGFGDFAVKIG